MTRTSQDFEFWTGEDKQLLYVTRDVDGASVNLTGYTVSWLMQDEPDSGSLLRYWTGGSGVVVSGCTAQVTLAASDTAGCALGGTYYSELSACDTAGNEAVLAVGTATIHRRGY